MIGAVTAAVTKAVAYPITGYANVLGDELLVNGDFATDTDWTKQTGWTIAGGVAVGASGSSSNMFQLPATALVQSTVYRMTWTVVTETGGGTTQPQVGNSSGTPVAGTGTFSEDVAAGSGDYITIRKTAAFDGTVDDISVKEVL